MVLLIALVSVLGVFLAGAVLRQRSPAARRRIPCAFCGSVVVTWTWMLLGRWSDVAWLQSTDALVTIGVLMGGSAVGFPTRLARAWRARGVVGADALRAGMITAGFILVLTALTGRWGWLAVAAIVVGIGAMVVTPIARSSPGSDAAQRSFLARLNHCCDES